MRDRYVDPVAELGGKLLTVEKPARYTGGEYGIKAKKDANFKTLIAFPDLYEIGMGNQALKIIYNRINNIQGVSCDRAFAPAPDFEKLLRKNNIPLYGLDTGIALSCLDLLMFTVGYELGLGGILLMLDASFIPLRCTQRREEHPIVIAGGPAVSNPAAFSPFADAFWIGEAEAGFFELVYELSHLKKSGKGRGALLEKISAHPNVYVNGKNKALRAIISGFGGADSDCVNPCEDEIAAAVFPVPSMKIIQHHGSVEIMRGCPNGCRFCHAGFWYRPMRQKNSRLIEAQVRDMVTKGGWHEISLSSLSSGDYHGIENLIENLNDKFRDMHVSFQLPSLKVSSFSLALLEKISVTRKSGLTFAVETPQDSSHNAWQMSVNKEVTLDSVTAILNEAKKRGWKTAKFYFMIGLPVPVSDKSEEEEIVNFITVLGRRTRMHFNINVGLFIPKPHTPYQWSPQLDSNLAIEKVDFIRSKLKPLGHKVSVPDTLISQIEGIISRGDERAGFLFEQAYLAGSRLDAWSEYISREKWLSIFEENKEMISSFMKGNNELPWQDIDSCVSNGYIKSEKEKSDNSRLTPTCKEKCSLCGVCGKDIKIIENNDNAGSTSNISFCSDKNDIFVNLQNDKVYKNKMDPDIYRLLFSFSKSASAVFHGHLSLIEIFSMAFIRAGVPVMYTKGFNPIAKMEFASPLTTGISSACEIASVDFLAPYEPERFISEMNSKLPQGFRIENAVSYYIQSGMKKHSLSSLLWGFGYADNGKTDYVKASEEKAYRQERLKECDTVFSLKRNYVLARNVTDSKDPEWSSYFDAYNTLYIGRQNKHYD